MKRHSNYIKFFGLMFFSVFFLISGFSISEKEVDSIMEKYIGTSVPGASVAVVKDGEIILSKGYGFADIEEQKLVIAEETVFEYGSINKLFVWVSAMQLVERNELDLGERIANYLPEEVRKNLNYTRPITFLDLMNHSAGFEDSMFDFARKDMDSLSPLEGTLQEHQPKQIFRPSDIISYSNYGSALAAYVIDEISGEEYFDYQRKNIFIPLKMISVAGHPLYKYNPELLKNKAKGYVPEENGLFKEKGWVYVPAYPSGAADGTVLALAKFALALTPEKPLDSPLFQTTEIFNQIFSKSYIPENIETSIAHGFWEQEGKIASFGHGGNTAGFTSFFSVSPKERLGLVVLTNSGEETDLIYELQELIYGEKEEIDFKGLEEPSPKEIIGRYLPARAPYNNFLELFSYLSAYEVTSNSPGEITLIIPGHEANYVQVTPYKYNVYDSSSLIIKHLYPELSFEIDGDSIKRVTSGNSVDLIPADTFRPWIWVNITVIILMTCMLLFLIQPFFLFIYKIKMKGKISKSLIFLNILGLSLFINNSLLIYRAFSYLYYSSGRVLPFIYGNITISILYLILIVLMFIFRKRINTDVFNKKSIMFYSLILFIFLGTLYNWNFMTVF